MEDPIRDVYEYFTKQYFKLITTFGIFKTEKGDIPSTINNFSVI